MKTYCITYSHITYADTDVKAANEKEARKKFKEVMPYEKIDKIWVIQSLEIEGYQ